MDDEELIEELVDKLENNGELKLTGEEQSLSIEQSDSDAYSYISSNGKRFESSRDAVEWLVMQFDGAENITEWE